MPETTPLTLLAERARSTGHEPWLFHRDGLDWCWRSWGRVADHVARSVEALHEFGTKPRRAGYAARQHPDAITIGLAIQAAGWIAVPVSVESPDALAPGCDVWVEIGGAAPEHGQTPDRVILPPSLSALERTPRRPLMLETVPGSVALPGSPEAGLTQRLEVLSSAEWARAAERLDGSLAPGAGRAVSGRSIVCAVPDLGPRETQLLEVWTLVRGAAWVLEPQASAFIETVLWARPTLVWARARQLEMLAARMRVRKYRRRSRLSSVVVVGGEEVDPGLWSELGVEVEVVALGRDPMKG